MDAIPSIVFFLLIAASFVVWVYAVADVARVEEHALRSGSKLVWLLVVLLGHFAGAVLYLALGRPRPSAG